jgi:hypothetical protein
MTLPNSRRSIEPDWSWSMDAKRDLAFFESMRSTMSSSWPKISLPRLVSDGRRRSDPPPPPSKSSWYISRSACLASFSFSARWSLAPSRPRFSASSNSV